MTLWTNQDVYLQSIKWNIGGKHQLYATYLSQKDSQFSFDNWVHGHSESRNPNVFGHGDDNMATLAFLARYGLGII